MKKLKKMLKNFRLNLHRFNFNLHRSRLNLHHFNFNLHRSRLNLHHFNFDLHRSRLNLHHFNFNLHRSRLNLHCFRFNLALLTFILLFTSSCDMKTELDVDVASFAPKLCISATLECDVNGAGTFGVTLREGRSLADFKTPRWFFEETVAAGVIRLYEGDNLVVEHRDEFSLRISDRVYDGASFGGYYFETAVSVNPGATYRLEVEADGYATARSTTTMPALPDVTANIDKSELLEKESHRGFYSLEGGGWYGGSGSSNNYHPLYVRWGARDAGRNYYALEIVNDTDIFEGLPHPSVRITDGKSAVRVNVGDLSKLQDNPEVENYNQGIDFDEMASSIDIYSFPTLLMSDIGFTENNAELTLYVTPFHYFPKPDDWDDDDEIPSPPQTNFPNERYEWHGKYAFHRIITFRVRHITAATFKYYRSLSLQSIGMGFFSEPANITGNIENGYGCFMAHSVREWELWNFESYRKGEYVHVWEH